MSNTLVHNILAYIFGVLTGMLLFLIAHCYYPDWHDVVDEAKDAVDP